MSNINEFKGKTEEAITTIKQDVAEVKQDVKDSKEEIKEEIGVFKEEVKSDIKELKKLIWVALAGLVTVLVNKAPDFVNSVVGHVLAFAK
jgi:hypothetical protein